MGEMVDYYLEQEDPFDPTETYWPREQADVDAENSDLPPAGYRRYRKTRHDNEARADSGLDDEDGDG